MEPVWSIQCPTETADYNSVLNGRGRSMVGSPHISTDGKMQRSAVGLHWMDQHSIEQSQAWAGWKIAMGNRQQSTGIWERRISFRPIWTDHEIVSPGSSKGPHPCPGDPAASRILGAGTVLGVSKDIPSDCPRGEIINAAFFTMCQRNAGWSCHHKLTPRP